MKLIFRLMVYLLIQTFLINSLLTNIVNYLLMCNYINDQYQTSGYGAWLLI